MKNLLLITSGFPYGELERSFLLTEFNELRKSFQIHIAALYAAGNRIIYPVPQEVRYSQYHVGSKWKRAFRLPAQFFYQEVREDLRKASNKTGSPAKKLHRLISILKYTGYAEEIEHQLDEIVKSEKIDLIYTYWCTSATVAALRLKNKYRGLKVITRFHGYDLFEERAAVDWQCLRGYIAKKCDRLIFVSKQGQEYFLAKWGREWEEKSLVSYLGCRKMAFIEDKKSDCLKIISCSSLIPLKRVELIIAALAKLPDDFRVEWHHFGDGESRQNCESNARELLDGRENIWYTFWGAVPNENLEDIYTEISPDLFLTASSSEGGVPVSIAEASAMGIPAVGTDVGGIPEIIINGVTGFLLPQNPTPMDIASVIIKYTALPVNKKEEMRKQAYATWKETFDAEKNAKRFSSVLQII